MSRWLWAHSSARRPCSRSIAWWSCLATLLLCLPASTLSGQSTPQPSPPSKESFQKFELNLQTVIAKVAFWKETCQRALDENASIRQSLIEEQKRYEELIASATEHSDASISSLEQALQTIRSLRLLLKASDDSVKTAQERLASAEAEHAAALEKASKDVRRLEDANFWLTVGLIVVGTIAVGEGAVLVFR